MADKKRKRDDFDDFFQIRAKGQYLRVSKEKEVDGFKLPSGAGI